ncbi:MAG TPA: AI-2E family transporter [Chitinophagales bacterium]|jgi:predicted PurR-regulated permease PerM|nr:AI-2E family transporter [Chitinophagales bacterium]MBP6153644.1 AI-2E family transporter [Chitinophagales bacterium]HQV77096.1 AI-2E family transporter [Chitinophagales bacterium]HQW77838.1 AI-2E family transporter [Chitinophagales bacterium]HRB18827.1 AI-2E family transporter [Chitinophagales bacterium]
MLSATFNERFRQVAFFVILMSLGILIFLQINFLAPGVLGAITLYFLNRKFLFNLIYQKKWNRYVATILLILVDAIVLLIPFGLATIFVVPKLQNFTSNANDLFQGIKQIIQHIDEVTGIELLSKDNLKNIPAIVSSYLPNFINIAANIFINISTMFFALFFLLLNASKIETSLLKFIPLKPENKKLVTSETKNIVTSYAIGIPVLAIAQGFSAYIGYEIFGIEDPMLWGFVTCVCSVIPFIGSSMIWMPLSVYLFTDGHSQDGLFLAIYCAVVVLNIDNVLRLFLLKAFANIHPLITLFGVITGLKLFGFMGLIFGPLLVSYLLLLVRIYVNEFSTETEEFIE